MLHVNTLTLAQVRTAFKPLAAAIANPTVVNQTPAVAAPMPGQSAVPDDATKMRMIQEMSNRSQMNLEWSQK